MAINSLNKVINLDSAILEGLDNLAGQGILTTDAQLNIQSWNHWLEIHSGFSASQIIGRNLLEVYPELTQRQLNRFYHQALQGQVAILSQRLHGYLLPMPSSILKSISPLMRQSVRIGPLREGYRTIGTITVIDDVTERVEREAELQKHQEHLEELVTQRTAELQQTLEQLKQAQAHLVQSEKMSSLGQLVAGVAHEINNPINFIYGNLTHVNQYVQDLLHLVQRYQECYPQPAASIQTLAEEIDLDFIGKDLPKILKSMARGAERISQIVLSLRNFSRLNEADMKWVDIHEGLDSTLMMLDHRLQAKTPNCSDIEVIRDYGKLPKVQCYAGQLNQVFMNILSNAIEALDEHNQGQTSGGSALITPSEISNRSRTIVICTEFLADSDRIAIMIGDNGPGMTPEVCHRLFEPFFTTKQVGSGTGLGMSITYEIVVQKHRGQVQCISAQGYGTAFLIYLPIKQS